MNIKEIRNRANEELIKNDVEDAVAKTSLLLQYILDMNKTELVVNDGTEISKEQQTEIFRNIKEIINGKPIQYITHHQEFMGLNFYVDENVLIPQPDTELLVEAAIHKLVQILNEEIKVLDLCTGSGAIAISLENYVLNHIAKNKDNSKNTNDLKKQNIKIYASDISTEALQVARKNAIINNEDTNIRFIKSDMFENINDKFDIIVSNPPYIETKTIQKLSKEVQHEPHIALDGGADGLEFYRIIAKEAKKRLKERGWILLEIGYNQREAVSNLLTSEGYKEITCIKDLGGNDRVIMALLGQV